MAQLNHIVLISSGQPSLNPRLVKEADTLADAGYRITILYAYWNDWGTMLDHELIASKKWNAIRVGGDPHSKPITFFLSKLIHKLAKSLNKEFRGKRFAGMAIARPASFLTRKAKAMNADLYIGHNLGALPAVVEAAKKHKKPCGFDAEDFHRNEVSDVIDNPDVVLKSRIEEIYLPQVDYLSTSSPLISEAYKKIFPAKQPVTILNTFKIDKRIQHPSINNSGAIRMFWFSQTIGINRGLEEVLAALKTLAGYSFELHLLGHHSREMKKLLDEYKSFLNIYVYDPLPPDEIPFFTSQFDIGLATENTYPYNRDICLTNKIFTYLCAGLAVAASNTSAQSDLIKKFPTVGMLYETKDVQSLANVLLYYYNNRLALLKARECAFEIARKELSWENESKKFLNLVEQTLNNR